MKIKEIKSTGGKRFPPLYSGLPKEAPFKKGDTLKVDTINNPNYRLGKENLIGRSLVVKECYQSDIGQMSVWIVKFEQQERPIIHNPYLAHHFLHYED